MRVFYPATTDGKAKERKEKQPSPAENRRSACLLRLSSLSRLGVPLTVDLRPRRGASLQAIPSLQDVRPCRQRAAVSTRAHTRASDPSSPVDLRLSLYIRTRMQSNAINRDVTREIEREIDALVLKQRLDDRRSRALYPVSSHSSGSVRPDVCAVAAQMEAGEGRPHA
jgi:hypothetical protein